MSESLIFSNDPLPGIQQQYDDWEPAPEFTPPPPAGVYSFYVAQIREEKEFTTQTGLRYAATVDLRIKGGTEDERAVMFQRFSNSEFERPRGSGKMTSTLTDLFVCAGQRPPLSNAQFSEALHSMVDRGPGVLFKSQIDWRGFCAKCYETKLVEITKAANATMAKDVADNDQKREASDFATKADSHRGFPEDESGNRKDTLMCPHCNSEVRAQVRIRRFIPVGGK